MESSPGGRSDHQQDDEDIPQGPPTITQDTESLESHGRASKLRGMSPQPQTSPLTARQIANQAKDSANQAQDSDSENSSSESPPPRHHKEMFGTHNTAGYIPMPLSDLESSTILAAAQSTLANTFTFPARIPAALAYMPKTPEMNTISKHPIHGAPGARMEGSQLFARNSREHGSLTGKHVDGLSSTKFSETTNNLGEPYGARKNLFTQRYFSNRPPVLPQGGEGSNSIAAPSGLSRPLPVRRKSMVDMLSPPGYIPEELLQAGLTMDTASDDDDDFLPIPPAKVVVQGPEDDAEDVPGPTRAEKGKGPQNITRDQSAGHPDGRPSVEVNLEIETAGHKMQAEIVELAEKFGLSYATVLRKLGFSRQQESREPNLANTFRKVHKHRLAAISQGNSPPLFTCGLR